LKTKEQTIHFSLHGLEGTVIYRLTTHGTLMLLLPKARRCHHPLRRHSRPTRVMVIQTRRERTTKKIRRKVHLAHERARAMDLANVDLGSSVPAVVDVAVEDLKVMAVVAGDVVDSVHLVDGEARADTIHGVVLDSAVTEHSI